ncbi:MAG: YcgL domain-containing protein [Pseudomonadota bacterium]
MLVQVYRSSRKAEMYLYTAKSAALSDVPEALLQQFGPPEPVMLLNLDGSRKLARVDAEDVVTSIQEQGFFLQMPPSTFSTASTPEATES